MLLVLHLKLIFILIKLLHHIALRFSHHFLVVIELGVIRYWTLLLPFFKENFPLMQKLLSWCFLKRLISINFVFLMYWMLPSLIVTSANVTLLLKYLAKLIYRHCLPLSMALLTSLLRKSKLLRNLENQ